MKTSNWVNGVVVVLCLAGCKSKSETVAGTASSRAPVVASAPRPEEPRGKPIPIAVGPALLILPGQGLGPIRIGATVATIERLMAAPCEEKDEKVCRYPARAVEFLLDEKGVAYEMRVHRGERVAGKGPRVYGIFNGRSQEGLAPLMLQSAVREMLGPPLKVEPVKDGGTSNTVEVYTYNGMRIEFDRMPTGSVVVGGIQITKG